MTAASAVPETLAFAVAVTSAATRAAARPEPLHRTPLALAAARFAWFGVALGLAPCAFAQGDAAIAPLPLPADAAQGEAASPAATRTPLPADARLPLDEIPPGTRPEQGQGAVARPPLSELTQPPPPEPPFSLSSETEEDVRPAAPATRRRGTARPAPSARAPVPSRERTEMDEPLPPEPALPPRPVRPAQSDAGTRAASVVSPPAPPAPPSAAAIEPGLPPEIAAPAIPSLASAVPARPSLSLQDLVDAAPPAPLPPPAPAPRTPPPPRALPPPDVSRARPTPPARDGDPAPASAPRPTPTPAPPPPPAARLPSRVGEFERTPLAPPPARRTGPDTPSAVVERATTGVVDAGAPEAMPTTPSADLAPPSRRQPEPPLPRDVQREVRRADPAVAEPPPVSAPRPSPPATPDSGVPAPGYPAEPPRSAGGTPQPRPVPTAPDPITALPPSPDGLGTQSGLPAAGESLEPNVDGRVRRRRRPGEDAPVVVDPTQRVVEQAERRFDPTARAAQVDRGQFLPDPTYTQGYDVEAQLKIYGGKTALPTPRPLLELGYPMYAAGNVGTAHNLVGEKNLVTPQLLVYGDFRTVFAENNDGVTGRRSLISNRLNLDVDLKLTGTERIHALFRPIDDAGQFTRLEFAGPGNDGDETRFETELTAEPTTAFFEGDLGQITQGLTNRYNGVDLPIAAGFVPLFFQNGVWLDDAFHGLALTWMAKNSRTLDISNMDFTFFAGFDEVSTGALLENGKLAQHAGTLYGLATFFERRAAYYEFDYAYIQDDDRLGGLDRSYHNLSAAVSARWHNKVSYSLRVITNLGQEDAPNRAAQTADGTLFLAESSFFTSKPYTLLPYANVFYGHGRTQSAARDPGAGGVLRNVGLNFETDNLTGFPKLDDTATDAYGGAFGLQYLFALDQQLVVEVAGLDRHRDDLVTGAEYALGVRYQRPISTRWIFRSDAVIGDRSEGESLGGFRVELRCKF